jgi:cation transport protein ChaC
LDTAVKKQRLVPPPGEDFWVFGYGSLMWHPGFPHLEVRKGMLYGYHRHFCVYSHNYRGTPDCPGLVLGLDKGGACRGLVYRVPAAESEAAMAYLYEREMNTGVYTPRWLAVRSDTGSGAAPVRAIAFVVDPSHRQYTGRLTLDQTLAYVMQGHGKRGPCVEYLENTVRHLRALGLRDRGLERLLHAAEARRRD